MSNKINKKIDIKIGGRNNGQSIYNASKLLKYIETLSDNKMYGIIKTKGITMLTKSEVLPKQEIKDILNKYAKKEIDYAPEFYKELKQLLEDK